MGVLSASRWLWADGNHGTLELLEAFFPFWIESYATPF